MIIYDSLSEIRSFPTAQQFEDSLQYRLLVNLACSTSSSTTIPAVWMACGMMRWYLIERQGLRVLANIAKVVYFRQDSFQRPSQTVSLVAKDILNMFNI